MSEIDSQAPQAMTEASYGLFSRSKDDGPGPLRALADKVCATLGKMVGDAAVLEVRTWTADDVAAVAGAPDDPAAAGAKLRAFTRIKVDGDVDVCVPTRDGAVDTPVWEVHREAVDRALAWRGEIVKVVLSAVSGSGGR